MMIKLPACREASEHERAAVIRPTPEDHGRASQTAVYTRHSRLGLVCYEIKQGWRAAFTVRARG
jgi:hypothetical protein